MLVLASASPRRRELLGVLVDAFATVTTDVPEPFTGDPMGDAVTLATAKARAAAARDRRATVVGSDTIVFDEHRAYGKPASPEDAEAMLAELSGRTHRVVTGLAVVTGDAVQTGASVSLVTLSPLSAGDIRAYVASGRPMDKAGAYAIQDEDVPTVSGLEGCYCSVMGLPLWRLKGMLEAAGIACRAPMERLSRCAGCPERPPT